MKIKKAFAWILAVAMVITLMPSMAFAATDNSLTDNTDVQTVKSGATLGAIEINLVLKEGTKITSSDGVSFKITLNNAEWASKGALMSNGVTIGGIAETSADGIGIMTTTNGAIVSLGAINPSGEGGGKIVNATKTEAEITVTGEAIELLSKGSTNKNDTIQVVIPAGTIVAGDDESDITLRITGSTIDKVVSNTNTPLVIGKVVNGDTTAKIEVAGDIPVLSAHETKDTAKIKISDIYAGSVKNGSSVTIIMDLYGDATFVEKGGSNNFATESGLFKIINPQNKVKDKQVTMSATVVDNGSGFVRNSTITPKISIDKDASEGDITVDIKIKDGNKTIASVSNLLIAKCKVEGVSVATVEEVPEIIAGREKIDDKNQTVQVTLTESMKKSLSEGRYIDFEFPDEVQICDKIEARLKDKSEFDNVADSLIDIGKVAGKNHYSNLDGTTSTALNLSSFSFKVPESSMRTVGKDTWKTDEANAVTFRIPVTVSADYEGDITLDVSGSKAGMNDTSIVVGKAVSPITIDTKTTEVVIGAQTQTLADITITEKAPGYFRDENKDTLELKIDTLDIDNGMAIQSFDSIDVTAGNVQLGKAKATKNTLSIPIKTASKTASTIEIKGLVVALARTLPEGDYALQIGGKSIVDNERYNDNEFAEYAAEYANYVHIVTPADDTQTNNPVSADVSSSAKIGEGTYTLNGQTVTMVGNPYVDSANRSMFPFRDLAGMCGLDRDKDVSWNNDTRTATITGYGKAVIVSIGNVTMTVIENGVPRYVTMDTEAVIKDNRTYLPARFVAEALGLTINWDQAAQTVTINS